MSKMKYIIQSILAAIRTETRLDLSLVGQLMHATQWHGPPHMISFRLDTPKVTVFVYKSGIIAFSGARSEEELEQAKTIVRTSLTEGGIAIPEKLPHTVWNIVATANLNRQIDLESLSARYFDQMIYDPESFSGAIFREKHSSLTVMAFGSGKLVLVGAKNRDDVESLLRHFVELLDRSESRMTMVDESTE